VSVAPTPEHHHRDVQGGAARAAVFGVSDGLVSNVGLILGVAGADASSNVVRVAGLAGLIAGAISMAAGEYNSVRVQPELLERELAEHGGEAMALGEARHDDADDRRRHQREDERRDRRCGTAGDEPRQERDQGADREGEERRHRSLQR